MLLSISHKQTDRDVDALINKTISPDDCLRSIRQSAEASESPFGMEDWHYYGAVYDTTLMAWHESFNNAWPFRVRNDNERVKRMYSHYLKALARAGDGIGIQPSQGAFSRGVENGLHVP
ncbi:class I SAM-dependent methyltransferase, partial [Salmonella enterica]|uniref:class I SAM-dependent methyltransferase n=1 Tax=Salmonella enterica TaxID=28901 RepID=UPI001F57C089